MRITKPDYYDRFKCIAEKCTFTCCQQWNINMDDATYAKWKQTEFASQDEVKQKRLDRFTKTVDGSRVIDFGAGRICPFLDCKGLCQLVIDYGDDMLTTACQVFPREKHEFEWAVEHALMPCCPVIVDFINESGRFVTISEGESGECVNPLVKLRAYLMELVQDDSIALETALMAGYYILRYEVPDNELEDNAFVAEFISKLDGVQDNVLNTVSECNELFLDLIDNYRAQGMYKTHLEQLWEMAELIGDDDARLLQYYDEFRRAWACYEPLFRKLMAQELYADLLTPGGDRYTMTIRMQWLEMQYVLMRHMCYLNYYRSRELSYHTVRDMIVLASRMMGYDEDYIFEYMEDGFEEAMWEWSYYFLLMGKGI